MIFPPKLKTHPPMLHTVQGKTCQVFWVESKGFGVINIAGSRYWVIGRRRWLCQTPCGDLSILSKGLFSKQETQLKGIKPWVPGKVSGFGLGKQSQGHPGLRLPKVKLPRFGWRITVKNIH